MAESADRYCVHRLPTGLDDYDGAPGLRHLVIVAGDLPAGLDGRRSRVLTGGATNCTPGAAWPVRRNVRSRFVWRGALLSVTDIEDRPSPFSPGPPAALLFRTCPARGARIRVTAFRLRSLVGEA